MEFFAQLSPVIQALLATLFTWGMTAVGAAGVFFTRAFNRLLLDMMLGFAAGVMIAASFWSLLNPAIAMAEEAGNGPAWLPAVVGFMLGGGVLRFIDMLLPHLHPSLKGGHPEGIPTHWRRAILMVLAITLHNIPEGLAVGVAFGAVASGVPGATLGGAVALALGIGIQNLPEGLAVALPLRGEGVSRTRSFYYGQLSAIVEPIAGVIGALAVLAMTPLLPYALSFAAGAMIFVVVEEVIPEAQSAGNGHIATFGTMFGFTIMMLLDVALS